jgi:hypothetical protein
MPVAEPVEVEPVEGEGVLSKAANMKTLHKNKLATIMSLAGSL